MSMLWKSHSIYLSIRQADSRKLLSRLCLSFGLPGGSHLVCTHNLRSPLPMHVSSFSRCAADQVVVHFFLQWPHIFLKPIFYMALFYFFNDVSLTPCQQGLLNGPLAQSLHSPSTLQVCKSVRQMLLWAITAILILLQLLH